MNIQKKINWISTFFLLLWRVFPAIVFCLFISIGKTHQMSMKNRWKSNFLFSFLFSEPYTTILHNYFFQKSNFKSGNLLFKEALQKALLQENKQIEIRKSVNNWFFRSLELYCNCLGFLDEHNLICWCFLESLKNNLLENLMWKVKENRKSSMS